MEKSNININIVFKLLLMRFFWILIIITTASVAFYLTSLKGLELIIPLLTIDLIALWTYAELEKKEPENTSLKQKIENLERLIYELFNRLKQKPPNDKDKKEELTEWLNKF
jgi:hypothetical protein